MMPLPSRLIPYADSNKNMLSPYVCLAVLASSARSFHTEAESAARGEEQCECSSIREGEREGPFMEYGYLVQGGGVAETHKKR